jgi:hypothetical protein
VGDKLTIIKKQQVTKTILVPGSNQGGKPGKPYIVKVSLVGFFAPEEERNTEKTETQTKDVSEVHVRVAADEI